MIATIENHLLAGPCKVSVALSSFDEEGDWRRITSNQSFQGLSREGGGVWPCAYETCVSAPGDARAGHAKTRKPRKRENGENRGSKVLGFDTAHGFLDHRICAKTTKTAKNAKTTKTAKTGKRRKRK